MSQWYDSEWEHEGSTYRSAEEWMMVQKARLFGDEVCWGFVFGKKAREPSPSFCPLMEGCLPRGIGCCVEDVGG